MAINMPEMEGTELAVAAPTGRRRSRIPGLDAMRATVGFQRGMLVAGVLIVLFFVVVAIFAPLFAPYGFNDNSSGGKFFTRLGAPSSDHWFGVAQGGEDVLSQVIFGSRTAIEV